MNPWQEYDFLEKVERLLAAGEFQLKAAHHFGRPWVTVYQLAAAFARAYPAIIEDLNMRVAGGTTEGQDSLPRYLSWHLSQGIQAGRITSIEGSWLLASGLAKLQYQYEGWQSGDPNDEVGGYSLYRLRD